MSNCLSALTTARSRNLHNALRKVPLWCLLCGSKKLARNIRNRSSGISEKQEPHHKEHQRDKYQQGKQVDDHGDHQEHNNKDQYYDEKI